MRREPGWDEAEPCVFRPARAGLQPVLERAFALVRDDAKRVIAVANGSAPEPERELQIDPRREKIRADIRARAMAPEDAWLRLVPKHWLGDQRRWLVGDKVARDGRPHEGPTLSLEHTTFILSREPRSLDYLTTLATDHVNVEAVESLAREACRRMNAWRSSEPPPVIWLAEEHVRFFDFLGALPFRAHADEMFGWSFKEPRQPPRAEAREVQWRDATRRAAKRDLMRANAWPKGPGAPPNPFESIMAIWLLGYALLHVVEVGVVLLAAAPNLEELLAPLVVF